MLNRPRRIIKTPNCPAGGENQVQVIIPDEDSKGQARDGSREGIQHRNMDFFAS